MYTPNHDITSVATVRAPNFTTAGMPPLYVFVGAMPGDTDYFQFWYRDPGGPCGQVANTTNGLRVTWGL